MQYISPDAVVVKVKDGFVLRNIADEYILMPVGDNIRNFNGTLLMNVPIIEDRRMKTAATDGRRILCIQWHPETIQRRLPEQLNLFKWLVREAGR